jgi:hypothetical protein
MSDDYVDDIQRGLEELASGKPRKKPLNFYGMHAEQRKRLVQGAWNRWREYSPADLRAIKEVVEEDLENAERWERLYRREDAEELPDAIRSRVRAQHLIRVLDALVRHHALFGAFPPEWEDVDYTEQQAAVHGRGARGTEAQIKQAIRKVIDEGDYPTSKVGFYTEVDKRREGVKEGSRASERWLRENWPGGLPEPEDWPDLL